MEESILAKEGGVKPISSLTSQNLISRCSPFERLSQRALKNCSQSSFEAFKMALRLGMKRDTIEKARARRSVLIASST